MEVHSPVWPNSVEGIQHYWDRKKFDKLARTDTHQTTLWNLVRILNRDIDKADDEHKAGWKMIVRQLMPHFREEQKVELLAKTSTELALETYQDFMKYYWQGGNSLQVMRKACCHHGPEIYGTLASIHPQAMDLLMDFPPEQVDERGRLRALKKELKLAFKARNIEWCKQLMAKGATPHMKTLQDWAKNDPLLLQACEPLPCFHHDRLAQAEDDTLLCLMLEISSVPELLRRQEDVMEHATRLVSRRAVTMLLDRLVEQHLFENQNGPGHAGWTERLSALLATAERGQWDFARQHIVAQVIAPLDAERRLSLRQSCRDGRSADLYQLLFEMDVQPALTQAHAQYRLFRSLDAATQPVLTRELQWAMQAGHEDTVQRLQRAGARPDGHWPWPGGRDLAAVLAERDDWLCEACAFLPGFVQGTAEHAHKDIPVAPDDVLKRRILALLPAGGDAALNEIRLDYIAAAVATLRQRADRNQQRQLDCDLAALAVEALRLGQEQAAWLLLKDAPAVVELALYEARKLAIAQVVIWLQQFGHAAYSPLFNKVTLPQ